MAELILFPDVEGLVRAYLLDKVASRAGYEDVTVSTKVPGDRPARFVRVQRTGGGEGNLITDSATLVVEAWAAKETDAVVLAQLCRGLLKNIDVVNGVQFYRTEIVSAPANLPDPNSGQVRYTASYAVRVRGSAE